MFEEFCKLYDRKYPDGQGVSVSYAIREEKDHKMKTDKCGCWKCQLKELREEFNCINE